MTRGRQRPENDAMTRGEYETARVPPTRTAVAVKATKAERAPKSLHTFVPTPGDEGAKYPLCRLCGRVEGAHA